MNKSAITALLFGAAIGFGIGYYYAERKAIDAYEDRVAEEVDLLRKEYFDISDEDEQVDEEEPEEKAEYEPADIPEHPTEEDYVSYHKVSPETEKPVKKEMQKVLADLEEQRRNRPKDEPLPKGRIISMLYHSGDDFVWHRLMEVDEEGDEPYFITEQMVDDNVYNNDRSTVSYFIQDGFVVDDNDTFVDNIDDLYGDLLEYVTMDTPSDEVYIRNNKLKLDTVVELVRSSFEEVAGRF